MTDFDPTDFAEQTLDSQIVFAGKLLKLRVDSVRLPDGGTSTREIIEHPGAVAAVPLTDDDHVHLVRQWRHPIQQVTLEIPAGTLDAGEDAQGCIDRELAEEIGMHADRLEHLLDTFVSQGYSDEVIRLYLATGLRPAERSPDKDEKLEVVKLPFDVAVRMCLSGDIQDAKSVIALLMAHLRRLGSGVQGYASSRQLDNQQPRRGAES